MEVNSGRASPAESSVSRRMNLPLVQVRYHAQPVAEAVAALDQVAYLSLDQGAADPADQLLDVVVTRLPGVPRQVADQLGGAHEAAHQVRLAALRRHAAYQQREELEL